MVNPFFKCGAMALSSQFYKFVKPLNSREIKEALSNFLNTNLFCSAQKIKDIIKNTFSVFIICLYL